MSGNELTDGLVHEATGSSEPASGAPAESGPADADLAQLLAAWGDLPADVRSGIVAAVQGAGSTA